MAKSDLLKQAQKSGLAPEGASADDYSEAELRVLLGLDAAPAWKGSASSKEPLIAPDGHETLSQADIDARSS